MSNWIQIGQRYVNLDTVTEVRIHDQRRGARLFFIGGGMLELDEDDMQALEAFFQQEMTVVHPVRKTISTPGARG